MMTKPFLIRPMHVGDIRQVMSLERRVFSMPWPAFIYIHEINHNPTAFMGVIEAPLEDDSSLSRLKAILRLDEKPAIAAYGGIWMDGREGHISTIASAPDYRGKGFGELMLVALLARAVVQKMQWVILEVRVSNTLAQKLYEKYGFEVVARLPEYYHDNQEDALKMRLDTLDVAVLRERFAALQARIPVEDHYSGLSV
jgi:[ribosomal protein S18]-alanine N-acetyltransferase